MPAATGEGDDLVAKHQLVLGVGAAEDGDSTRLGGVVPDYLLQERAHGGHADSRGYQQNPRTRPSKTRERPVRTFDEHPRTRA